MQQPEVVVFDLGKVLVDFDYAKLGRNIQEHCEVPMPSIMHSFYESPLMVQYETGALTSRAFFEAVKKLSGFRHGFERFAPIFADIFTEIPEMIDLQRRLKERGVPTYIFSNTNELAINHIRAKFPFFSNFTEYIYSYEHGAMKPDPRLYEVVERVTGKKGGQILYIDDRAENIDQGRERGWHVILQVAPERTIPRVEELFLR